MNSLRTSPGAECARRYGGSAADETAHLPWLKTSRAIKVRALRLLAEGMLKRAGLSISRYRDSTEARRKILLNRHAIDLVLDVGANKGQYAKKILDVGYRGDVISFEPLPSAFAELEIAAERNPQWTCVNLAVGETNAEVFLNESANSQSSSILSMLPSHVAAAPESRYVAGQLVRMTRLDSYLRDRVHESSRVWLKLDVQGYERRVLEGATDTIPLVQVIETELSLIPLYASQQLMCDDIGYLADLGFRLVWIQRGYRDVRSGDVLQVNGIFVRHGQ